MDTSAASAVGYKAPSAGVFDISVDYFDEADGVSRATLLVDGVEMGTWAWDANLGSNIATLTTLSSRTFSGITLHEGSVIEIVGQGDGGEPLRLNALRLEKTPIFAQDFEAESARTLENFSVRDLLDGSGGKVLQAGNTGTARAVFDFYQTGVFDIKIDYFDENDGTASMTLRVDGVDVGSWLWDKDLGSKIAEAATRTSRVFSGIELHAGSVVELIGTANAGEPVRVDSVHFMPTTLVSEYVEAEAASSLQGFSTLALSCASGGVVLQAAKGATTSTATFAAHQAGTFDISVDYFDENDGVAVTTLRVDGVDVATWSWDANLGSAIAEARTHTTHTISGVQLHKGSVVELVGHANGGEPLRIDGVHFTPAQANDGIFRGAPVKTVGAFEGAEGYGASTVGGRGGQVVHVTNLDDSGVGSLRWALQDVKGARIVVFDVEGQIQLKSAINVTDPFVTLAGQSAPGQGVVVSGARLHIDTHDVIVRGMKWRVGDGPGDTPASRDNISIGGGADVHHIVIDHNSLTWSIDENMAIWGTVRNVTISNNIIAEGLYNSIHVDEGATTTDPHSMGMIVGHKVGDANSEFITITKNLFASNMFRNAYIKGADGVEFVNNYVYNYGAGHQGLQLGSADSTMSIIVAGNAYADGKNTSWSAKPAFDLRALANGSTVLLKDNYVGGHRESSGQAETAAAYGKLDLVTDAFRFATSGTVILDSKSVAAHVLEHAGARLVMGGLDVVDLRIVNGVISGTTSIIDSQKQVGGYAAYTFTGAKVVDSDHDGMPDWFETAYHSKGFNAHVADDKLDFDNDGYTNIEEYLNGLIDGFDL